MSVIALFAIGFVSTYAELEQYDENMDFQPFLLKKKYVATCSNLV